MDTFFCREAYGAALGERGVKSEMITVDANHWTVLTSRSLYEQLSKKFGEGWGV
jgi:hypothetical protein